jgi:threonine/homoserine efflux transporter RhtA
VIVSIHLLSSGTPYGMEVSALNTMPNKLVFLLSRANRAHQ